MAELPTTSADPPTQSLPSRRELAWLYLSQGSRALRVALAGALVGLFVVIVFTVLGWRGGAFVTLIETPLGWIYALALPIVVYAPLIAVTRRLLDRLYPFTQMLLFAAMSAVVVGAVVALIDAYTVATHTCEPNVYCFTFGEGLTWFGFLYLGPLFLSAAVTYSVAQWATERRRLLWVVVPVLICMLVLFATLLGLARFGVITKFVSPMPLVTSEVELLGPSMCTEIGSDGVERSIVCPGGPSGERSGPTSEH